MFHDLTIILASASPRRKELLNQIGIEPVILPADIDEQTDLTDPAAVTAALSQKKGAYIAEKIKKDHQQGSALVIAADTVVVLDRMILGKPKDKADAAAMLKSLSGRSHEVITGVALYAVQKGKIAAKRSFTETTMVHVCELTEEEILDYAASKEPMDKAGAYAIQGVFGKYITGIEGNYANVVGLPISSLYREMKGIIHELQ